MSKFPAVLQVGSRLAPWWFSQVPLVLNLFIAPSLGSVTNNSTVSIATDRSARLLPDTVVLPPGAALGADWMQKPLLLVTDRTGQVVEVVC